VEAVAAEAVAEEVLVEVAVKVVEVAVAADQAEVVVNLADADKGKAVENPRPFNQEHLRKIQLRGCASHCYGIASH
jgi:hypothetical protein